MIELLHCDCMEYMATVPDKYFDLASSAIAAHYFGVDFVGCELDKDYFEAAKARFDMATRQLAMSI